MWIRSFLWRYPQQESALKKKKKKKRNLLYNCVILESPAVPANWLTVIESSSGLGKGSLPQ